MENPLKFTEMPFIDWLQIIRPDCTVRINVDDGRIYEGKQKEPLVYEMKLIGTKIGDTTIIF